MTLVPAPTAPADFVPVVDTWYTAQPAPRGQAALAPRGDRQTVRVAKGRSDLRQQLQHSRMAAGLSQGDLARRSGVAIRTIQQIEHGDRRFPPRKTLEQLSSVLGARLSPAVQ
jgi:DNA-binding XRE family transcriptional regulator